MTQPKTWDDGRARFPFPSRESEIEYIKHRIVYSCQDEFNTLKSIPVIRVGKCHAESGVGGAMAKPDGPAILFESQDATPIMAVVAIDGCEVTASAVLGAMDTDAAELICQHTGDGWVIDALSLYIETALDCILISVDDQFDDLKLTALGGAQAQAGAQWAVQRVPSANCART